MLRINKETQLCISIAERPSNFGTTVFNAAFAAAGIDFIYKACKLDPSNLKGAIAGIRALGIRGCGVSMPFKVMAIEYMDDLDQSAVEVGALNTILNEDGRLKGFNTDYYGAGEALRSVKDVRNKTVLVLGSGGVAMAICAALKSLGVDKVTIANRTAEKASAVAEKWQYPVLEWEQRKRTKGDILINATSMGMNPHPEEIPVDEESIKNFGTVMDVVISPVNTRLLQAAKAYGKVTVPGSIMCLYQAVKQYEIYTGLPAPVEVMSKSMRELLEK